MKRSLICLLILFVQISWAKIPKKIKSLEHDKPAFVEVVADGGVSDLYVSSFKLMGGDSVKKYLDIENLMNNRSVRIETTADSIVWPNEIEKYPSLVEGDEALVVASGFFPPTKNNGGIYLVNKRTNAIEKISKDKNGWWYHRTRFWDYDRDGRLDIVTARAYKGMFWGKDAELIVLLAPNGSSRTSWEEEFLFKGPDVFFELVDFDGDDKFEVISSQFLFENITYHYLDELNGEWTEKVIDHTIGPGFDLSVIDLNNDGQKEVLVTNHVSSDQAGVFAYEIPTNPRYEQWPKHVIHQGFKTTARGIGQASPGNAKAFKPDQNEDTPLSIVVSGDGNEKVHLFSPTGTPWKYQHEVIYEGRGIIGKVTTSDADRDGRTEIYIPAYDENKIHIFEY